MKTHEKRANLVEAKEQFTHSYSINVDDKGFHGVCTVYSRALVIQVEKNAKTATCATAVYHMLE